MTDSGAGELTAERETGPVIVSDPDVTPRLRAFLAGHVTVYPRTSASSIRRRVRAMTEDGQEMPVPVGAVEIMLAYEERFGGLTYAVLGWPNSMEYGLDGDTSLHQTPLGWAFYGVLDGSLTAPLDVLLDGRVTAWLGAWPQRVLDDSVEQRLTKHALLVEVNSMHRVRLKRSVTVGQPPLDPTSIALPPIADATGGADLWWRDTDAAIWCQLTTWPATGPDRWTITCLADTTAKADELADAVSAATPEAVRIA